MSEGSGSSASVTPRLCERCGKRMPRQKRGRPRRWCSQLCRQSAYEERRGLQSWKDKQPKVDDLSDVVEVMQDRAARRPGGGIANTVNGRILAAAVTELFYVVARGPLSLVPVEEAAESNRKTADDRAPDG